MTTHSTFVGAINYSNRLGKTYTKYVNQSVSFEMTILEFIEKYYELSERKKFQNLCKFIDKINIMINNIQITSENLSHNLNLIDAKTEIMPNVVYVGRLFAFPPPPCRLGVANTCQEFLASLAK